MSDPSNLDGMTPEQKRALAAKLAAQAQAQEPNRSVLWKLKNYATRLNR